MELPIYILIYLCVCVCVCVVCVCVYNVCVCMCVCIKFGLRTHFKHMDLLKVVCKIKHNVLGVFSNKPIFKRTVKHV